MIHIAVCKCGHYDVPTLDRCVNCGQPMSPMNLDARGIVLTWTTLHNVPEGLPRPLHLALVELANGMKMLCRGNGHANGIGAHVRVREESGIFLCVPYDRSEEFRSRIKHTAAALLKKLSR